MFCTYCAHPIADPDRPCDHCGAERQSAARVAHPATARTARRWTVGALPAFALLLVLAGFGVRRLEHERSVQRQYDAGRAALTAGDLLAARDAFGRADGYRDAEAQLRALDAQLAPFMTAEEQAANDLDNGRFDDAIALLLPVARALPDDDHAFALLAEARTARYASLEQTATADEQAGNWLDEQQTLTSMVAERPDDPGLAARLAQVKRDHAPLIYARDGDLYVAAPDGTSEHKIVSGLGVTWPMWSPDQSQIAFATRPDNRRAITGDLYVVNADGSGLRLLASDYLPFAWPVWSPDGTRIAYSDPSDFDVSDGSGSINLAIVEVATGRITDVTHDQFDYADSPSWSPDGTRLAFVDRIKVDASNGYSGFVFGNGDVHVFDLATGTITDITGDRLQNESQVSWSPVDDRLLIYTNPGDWSSDDESQIVIWDLASGAMTAVPTDVRTPGPAAWSPDGTRIAWVEGTDTIKVWSAAGIEWARVTTDVGYDLSWAPDGHALFVPGSAQSNPSYVVSVDRQFGARQQLKIAFDDNRATALPVWAPQTSPSPPVRPGGTALDPET